MSSPTRRYLIVLAIAALHLGTLLTVAAFSPPVSGGDPGAVGDAIMIAGFALMLPGLFLLALFDHTWRALAFVVLVANSLLWGLALEFLLAKIKKQWRGTTPVACLIAGAVLCPSVLSQDEHVSTTGVPARLAAFVSPGAPVRTSQTERRVAHSLRHLFRREAP
jgi:hypothetical protein